MPELAEVPMRDAEVPPTPNVADQLRLLERHYKILNRDDLIMARLDESPSTYPLLMEAAVALQNSFGADRILQIRMYASDDDTLLQVAVQLPRSFENPEHALNSFDSDWWLNNCQRSDGTLVFDYEIRDGV